MPSQFEQVTAVLGKILTTVARIEAKIDLLREIELDDLFGEDTPGEYGRQPFADGALAHAEQPDEDAEVLRPKMPGVTRRLVEVKGVDGNVKTVSRDELDPRILQVLDASIKAGTFWFLYERESDGQIMISAEERVVNQVGRGAVPSNANEPDLSE